MADPGAQIIPKIDADSMTAGQRQGDLWLKLDRHSKRFQRLTLATSWLRFNWRSPVRCHSEHLSSPAIEPVTVGKTKPLGSNRLLIVDDEVGITHVIESAALELGFESLAIHETEQFEAALQTISPTIIFLDISMPKRDGVELIAYLSAWNYPGRVVIMSGHPLYLKMSSTLANACGLRLADLLTKPFRKQQILDLLLDLAERPTE
jgi:CheY-like chemotaxis protein